jgi:5-methyltetrahydropteroyltriglutamate--homocysteine methyltransferase
MKIPNIKIILANYFDCFGENLATALSLPVHTLHRFSTLPLQLDDILESNLLSNSTSLSLGVVDGNIWKNDFKKSVTLIRKLLMLWRPTVFL